jgi:hypothetical protein
MAEFLPKDVFRSATINARKDHENGGSYEDLVTDSIFNAMRLIIAEKSRLNPNSAALASAAIGVSSLRHIIKGAVSASIENLRHPEHSTEDHHDYFSSMKGHISRHVQRDVDSYTDQTKQALQAAGINV